jgi:phosphotransferase system  glucose/maltose/N-acetylglucosamine-specific IIC component
MRKTFIVAVLFSMVLLTGLGYAANWQTVTTFQGSANTTTNYFKVDATEWRIKWSYTPQTGIAGDFAGFSVFIYPKGETVDYVDFILKTGRNETSGTLYVHQGGKEYYLKIGAANVDVYTITVEQDTDTIPKGAEGGSSLGITVIIIVIVVAIVLAVMLFRRRKKATTVKA